MECQLYWTNLNPPRPVQCSIVHRISNGFFIFLLARPLAVNSAYNVPRNISLYMTDMMQYYNHYGYHVATGPAGHWDPMRSLSQLQPVMPPFFYGQGNPSSLEARLSSSSCTLTNGFSDMWCPPIPSQQTNLFRTMLSNPGTRTSNTLMLPEIHPEYNHSSSAENPFSFHEYCSFATSYMREIEAREHPEWMMDDRFFDDITDASIDDSAGGEFVDDPIESSWYDRSYYEPHILPPPADVFASQTTEVFMHILITYILYVYMLNSINSMWRAVTAHAYNQPVKQCISTFRCLNSHLVHDNY